MKCPNCGVEFKLDEALMGPIREKLADEYRMNIEKRDLEIKKLKEDLERDSEEREKLLNERMAEEREKLRKEIEESLARERSVKVEELERLLKEKDERLKQSEEKEMELLKKKQELEERERRMELDVMKRLEEEKRTLIIELEKDMAERSSRELRELEEKLKQKEAFLEEARKKELELMKKHSELEEKQKEMELEIQRKLMEERSKLEKEIRERHLEEQKFKDAEKEKTIRDLQEQIEVLRQKAEQGSQQLQGEVLELELEEELSRFFPYDEVIEVKKGQRGADIVQKVRTTSGYHCGTIVWETKRAKNWSGEWLPKLKDDMKSHKADMGVLCSTVLPKDVDRFTINGDVVVTRTVFAIPVATLIREQIIRISRERNISESMSDKKDLLFSYLTGSEFRQNMGGMVEAFMEMKRDLDSEKNSMERIWSKREKQMVRVLKNLSSIYGSMQGIAGASMPLIKGLEMDSIPERSSGNTLDEFE